VKNKSQVSFSTSDLGCLNGAHFGDPPLGWLELSDCPNLITSVAWNANIVVTLKDKLNVTNLKTLGATCLGTFAGRVDDLVYELIGDRENAL
jgi:hypothetical protein